MCKCIHLHIIKTTTETKQMSFIINDLLKWAQYSFLFHVKNDEVWEINQILEATEPGFNL